MPRKKPPARRDPAKPIILRSFDGPLPFSVAWDDVALFRLFEATAVQVARSEGHQIDDTLPAEAFDASPVAMSRAAAIAREATLHFKMTLPVAVKAEIDRLLVVAFATGNASLTAHQTANGPSDSPIQLQAAPAVKPDTVIASRDFKDFRRRTIERAASNARSTHPKSLGKEKGHKDAPDSPRGKKTAERDRRIADEMRGMLKAMGIESPADQKAIGRELFSPRATRRDAKTKLHKTLAARENVGTDTIKRRRLRGTRKRR